MIFLVNCRTGPHKPGVHKADSGAWDRVEVEQ